MWEAWEKHHPTFTEKLVCCNNCRWETGRQGHRNYFRSAHSLVLDSQGKDPGVNSCRKWSLKSPLIIFSTAERISRRGKKSNHIPKLQLLLCAASIIPDVSTDGWEVSVTCTGAQISLKLVFCSHWMFLCQLPNVLYSWLFLLICLFGVCLLWHFLLTYLDSGSLTHTVWLIKHPSEIAECQGRV